MLAFVLHSDDETQTYTLLEVSSAFIFRPTSEKWAGLTKIQTRSTVYTHLGVTLRVPPWYRAVTTPCWWRWFHTGTKHRHCYHHIASESVSQTILAVLGYDSCTLGISQHCQLSLTCHKKEKIKQKVTKKRCHSVSWLIIFMTNFLHWSNQGTESHSYRTDSQLILTQYSVRLLLQTRALQMVVFTSARACWIRPAQACYKNFTIISQATCLI